MKYFFLFLFSNLLFANELTGVYKSQAFLFFKSAYVEFFEFGGKYYAYGIENADHSPAKKDYKNPNPLLRDRSDKGVVFLSGLTETSPNNYKYGRAYNFYDGRTYYVKIHQKHNGDLEFHTSIDASGYIGKTFLWKKVTDKDMQQEGIIKPNFDEVLKTIPEIKP